MIASHSSSFIRSSRLSRVMPALLTRIVIAPKRGSIAVERGIDRRAIGDVERHSGAGVAGALQIRRDLRRAFVGGRRADHGRAVRRQRQRDRPPDAARRAGDERDLPCTSVVRHVRSVTFVVL